MVVKSHPRLSLKEQCKILSISRSKVYYKPKDKSILNLRLMEAIDKQFLEHPYYGVERMTDYLNMDLNVKRIRRTWVGRHFANYSHRAEALDLIQHRKYVLATQVLRVLMS